MNVDSAEAGELGIEASGTHQPPDADPLFRSLSDNLDGFLDSDNSPSAYFQSSQSLGSIMSVILSIDMISL